jgi:hypothetical protein
MYAFDRDIESRPIDGTPFDFAAEISPNWAINGLPNGGYLMALLARAIEQKRNKKRMAIVTANYIQRTAPGPVRLSLERISETAQFERFGARLLQEDRVAVAAIATFMDDQMVCRVDRYEAGVPALAPLDQCVSIPTMPKFTLFDQVEVRLDPSCAGWMTTGQLADRSEHKGWIQFRDGRPYDALALLLAADCFPPPAYASLGLGAWVPTIELSVNIRKMPSSRWLKCFFHTRFITCGLLEEDGEIWDEGGELIAISRQIAQYRL